MSENNMVEESGTPLCRVEEVEQNVKKELNRRLINRWGGN